MSAKPVSFSSNCSDTLSPNTFRHLTHFFGGIEKKTSAQAVFSLPSEHLVPRAAFLGVILRLTSAPGHPKAGQSEGSLSSPQQNPPLAEPSIVTLYHLNQTDICTEWICCLTSGVFTNSEHHSVCYGAPNSEHVFFSSELSLNQRST